MHLARHAAWASKKYTEETEIVSYSVAIATGDEQGRWTRVRESAEIESKFKLLPGQTKQLKAETLLIPIDGIKQLDKHWIVLTLKLRSPDSADGYGYTHAHSEKLKAIQ